MTGSIWALQVRGWEGYNGSAVQGEIKHAETASFRESAVSAGLGKAQRKNLGRSLGRKKITQEASRDKPKSNNNYPRHNNDTKEIIERLSF